MIVKCCVCDKEVPEEMAVKRFTGRVKFICLECEKAGNKQAMLHDFSSGKVKRWREKREKKK